MPSVAVLRVRNSTPSLTLIQHAAHPVDTFPAILYASKEHRAGFELTEDAVVT
jgi:hypothetical protein